ncbi:MAG: HPr family phosphocarrier protein [Rhodospirillaceae bacterium]|nr:HPr family phosphocarrier protein [Rhodospirillaceae bacterium]
MPSKDNLRELAIRNERGLHARAAAKFVKTVGEFNAETSVSKDGQTVNGSSIMGLMMLAAGIGSTIEVKASGTEAGAALDALEKLVDDKFGEEI